MNPPRAQTVRRLWLSVLHWLVQIAIAVVGFIGTFEDGMTFLLLWCVLGTLYAIVVIISLGVLARGGGRTVTQLTDMPLWFDRLRGVVTTVLTIIPPLVGVSAATLVIVFGRMGKDGGFLASALGDTNASMALAIKFIGVWAMLLAWVLLHWGYAQVYLYRTERVLPARVLDFPATKDPSLVDHVYFAFTIGTTFAASDVSILTTRTRWTVLGHSVLSFFLNAMIIVLSFNTIMGAGS